MAALVFGGLFRYVGWRGMFVIGALPAFLVIYVRTKVEESPAWLRGRVAKREEPHRWKDILTYAGTFVFLVLLMFSFNSFSHGTQDLYPTFLMKDHGFDPRAVSVIAILANVGALLGGIVFGAWSERIGRKRAIVVAALLAIPVTPLWAYAHSVLMLAVGGFLMQFMVQGAWGVVPAHLNELSPPAVRGTFPGLGYQLGTLLSSWNIRIQAKLVEQRYGGLYAPVLAWTVLIIGMLVAAVTWSGHEQKGADLSRTT